MKIIVRVKNAETKRYRKEYETADVAFVDSMWWPDSINDVPMILDSICVVGNMHTNCITWVNLSPAWNKKKPARGE